MPMDTGAAAEEAKGPRAAWRQICEERTKRMYLISSCLLGANCKYNGGNNFCQEVADFRAAHSLLRGLS